MIFSKLQLLLGQAREFEAFSQELTAGVEPELRVAISSILPLDPVIEVLKKFAQEMPITRVRLSIEHMNLAVEAVMHGEADLGVCDVFEYSEELVEQPWREVELLPVCSHDFPLAAREGVLEADVLRHYTQVIVSNRPARGREYSGGIVIGANQWLVTDFPTKKAIIEAGLGWGRLPRHLICEGLSEGRLKVLSVGSETIRTIYLARRKGRACGPGFTKLWELFSGA